MDKIVETDNASGFSEALLKGLKKLIKSSEFDFKYLHDRIRTYFEDRDYLDNCG